MTGTLKCLQLCPLGDQLLVSSKGRGCPRSGKQGVGPSNVKASIRGQPRSVATPTLTGTSDLRHSSELQLPALAAHPPTPATAQLRASFEPPVPHVGLTVQAWILSPIHGCQPPAEPLWTFFPVPTWQNSYLVQQPGLSMPVPEQPNLWGSTENRAPHGHSQ